MNFFFLACFADKNYRHFAVSKAYTERFFKCFIHRQNTKAHVFLWEKIVLLLAAFSLSQSECWGRRIFLKMLLKDEWTWQY